MADQAWGVEPRDFAEHLAAPAGRGALPRAPHAGAAGGAACGDVLRIAVRIEGDRVAEAGFEASGCGALTAACSATVELVEGQPVLDAARLTPDDVSRALGGLSPGKLHAASFAADALHRAIGVAAREGAIRIASNARRTLVAMSGGVDSAMAAQLAAERGDEVLAVTLELWADPAGDGHASCCSPQALTAARALAHRMGLPHLTLDLRSAFRAAVVDDFVAEHDAGGTPNPCVRCNGLVRFDALLRLAGQTGAGRLATGHYARIGGDADGPLLRAAADPGKDQTYMLSRLAAEQLERLWFPLGELRKPDVRELARSAGLPVADRAESQDLCFLAGVGREAFLARHGEAAHGDVPGELVAPDGRRLGTHPGHRRFTVGQRRGIGVAGREPLYVIHKDAPTNRVTVGPRAALATDRVTVTGATLMRPGAAVNRAKLRYRARPAPALVEGDPPAGSHRELRLTLAEAVEGVAPGQTACLMRDDLVVGWATIGRSAAPWPGGGEDHRAA